MNVHPPRAALAEFASLCADRPYVPKGVFYSEVFLFLWACRQAGVTVILESGVKYGTSTRILRAAFDGAMVSIDQVVCPTPPGVAFIHGDACVVLPDLIERCRGGRFGVLIDGPKGETALALKDVCLSAPDVRVVAVHDVPPGHGETIHSHDPRFRHAAGRALDALITHPYATKYPDGPGLGIWLATSHRETP
jgi:hypothetical protein